MKQIYKKIMALLLAVICTFGLTACGNEKDEFKYISDDVVAECESETIEWIEEFLEISDAEWQQLLSSPVDFGRVTAEVWVEQTDVLGHLVSIDTTKIESEANEEDLQVTVTVPAKFEKNDGTISIVYSYDQKGITISPMYTQIAEAETFAGNMYGAVINTIIGVGMVFAVLFFLILIISSMKYVNVIGRKKEEPKKAAAPVAPVAAPVEEDVTDDLELVAVIAAAIAAAENTSTDSFVVRSIKKVNRSKWQRA